MNLPPKLLARLKKRGITVENKKEDKEEIFAENYDDDNKSNSTNKESKSLSNSDPKYIVYEVANCPNLSNPYHKCVEYCLEKYEKKKFHPASEMIKKRDRMLRRYPLPPNWIEVADPSTNRFYYWNTRKDEVSWLCPGHPRAVVRAPRDKGRTRPGDMRPHKRPERERDRDRERGEREYSRERRRRRHSSSESRSSGSSNRSRSNDSGDERRSSKHRVRKEKSDRRKEEKKRLESDPTLDPMDPAAYSDVPRGTWKTGLDVRGSAKTGVDVTASGPLFQQRPYPSPGDILRQNAMLDSKKNSDGGGGGSDNERENGKE